MLQRGFTLLELLLVVGILGVASTMAIPFYREYQVRNDLNVATEQVTQGLQRARLLAQNAQNDDGWGFYVPSGTLYRGKSYGGRNVTYDEVYSMPSTITTSGLLEVAYSKLKGNPNQTGSIILTAIDQEQRTILIEVQNQHIGVVQGDNLTICHLPLSANPQTMLIYDAQWPAYQAQGDTLGACPIASSSSSSSKASSVSSSSSSSNAGAGGGSSAGGGNMTICHYPPGNTDNFETQVISSNAWPAHQANGDIAGACPAPTCPTGFVIAGNGSIVTAGTQTVTFNAIASHLTYGIGGPSIPVTINESTDGGKHWTALFGGNAISGGETQTVSVPDGSHVDVQEIAYFKKQGWLTYSASHATNDRSGYTQIFANGQTVPAAAGYNGQPALRSVLLSKGLADNSGHATISAGGVLMVGELGSCLNCASADFQDAIVKMQFSGNYCP